MSQFLCRQEVHKNRITPLSIVVLSLLLAFLIPVRGGCAEMVSDTVQLQNALNDCVPGPREIILETGPNLPNEYPWNNSGATLTIHNECSKDITLISSDPDFPAVISGYPPAPGYPPTPDNARVIEILALAPSGETGMLTLENIIIAKGGTTGFGGGIFISPGEDRKKLVLTDCLVLNNSAGASGGGVALSIGSSLLAENTVFRENRAYFNGGAIYNFGGHVSLPPGTPGNTFVDNAANAGNLEQALGGKDLFTHAGAMIDTTGTSPTLDEFGEQVTSFDVKLHTPPYPGDTTIISVSSDEPDEVSLLPTALSFTEENFNSPQSVAVRAVNDVLDDGDLSFNLLLAHGGMDGIDFEGYFSAGIVPITTIDDDAVTLADVIRALRIVAGISGVDPDMAVIDINGDERIGVAEAIHVLLKVVAGYEED